MDGRARVPAGDGRAYTSKAPGRACSGPTAAFRSVALSEKPEAPHARVGVGPRGGTWGACVSHQRRLAANQHVAGSHATS